MVEEDEEEGDDGAAGWRFWAIIMGLVAAVAIAGLGFTFWQLRETRD